MISLCKWRDEIKDFIVNHKLASYTIGFLLFWIIFRADKVPERRHEVFDNKPTKEVQELTDPHNYKEKFKKAYGKDSFIPGFITSLNYTHINSEIDTINTFYELELSKIEKLIEDDKKVTQGLQNLYDTKKRTNTLSRELEARINYTYIQEIINNRKKMLNFPIFDLQQLIPIDKMIEISEELDDDQKKALKYRNTQVTNFYIDRNSELSKEEEKLVQKQLDACFNWLEERGYSTGPEGTGIKLTKLPREEYM